jgi:hypothetical protein
MNQRQLPYLHFMTKLQNGRKTGLVSPAEVEEGLFLGGCYVAPVRDDGSLFLIYRFDFSLYLGRGEFRKPHDGRTTFNGIAVSIADGTTNALHCTFEYPSVQMPTEAPPNQPSWFFQRHESRIEPLFRVVRSRSSKPLHYTGSLRHRDFKNRFVELEPFKPSLLDDLLEKWGVSIIGCEPASKYGGMAKRVAANIAS